MASEDVVIKLQADIRDLTGKVSQVTSSFSKLESTVRSSSAKINGSIKSISGAANLAKTAFAGIALGNVTRSTVELADAMTNMRSRIRLVTSSTEEAAAVQQQLLDVANRTRTDFTAIGELYARLGRSADDLGLSQQRLIAFVETFSQALKVSGASGAEAQSTILQLSQALSSGRLQGAELNAVLEAGGRASQALADGLGVPIGELKKLGEQGKLTSDVVIRAIESQASVISTEYTSMKVTASDAFTVLQNAIAETIGKMNESTGATDQLSATVLELANRVKDPAFIEGLKSVAAAVVEIARVSIEAASAVGRLYTNIKTLGGILPENGPGFASKLEFMAGGGKFNPVAQAAPAGSPGAPAPAARPSGGSGGGGGQIQLSELGSSQKADAARQYANAVEELNFQIEQLGRSQEAAAYTETLRNNLARAGVVIDSERGEQIALLTAQIYDMAAAQEAVAEAEAAAAEAGARWQDMKDAAGEAVASAFERAILEGEELSEVFKGLAQDLTRMILQKMVFDQIAGAVSGGLGSILSGGKALGGAVHAGSAYRVGESGPEIFVPRVPGNIVPRGKAGGSVVNIQSIVHAAPGTNKAELQAMLNQRDAELIKRIPRVMVDKQRRNALSGAF